MYAQPLSPVANMRNELDQRQKAIDLNAGVSIRTSKNFGMQIFMYKHRPGEYFNAFGKPVPEALAAEAGFNVALLAKEKAKLDRMGAARAAIEREFAEVSTVRDVREERDGFKLVFMGADRFNVEDPDGNTLNQGPLPESIAKKLFNTMAPTPAEVEQSY